MQPLQKLTDQLIPTQHGENSVAREMGMRRAIFLLIASLLLWCGSMLIFLDLANAGDNQGQVALIGLFLVAIGGSCLWVDFFEVTAWFARERHLHGAPSGLSSTEAVDAVSNEALDKNETAYRAMQEPPTR
jgi:hypothetical protein